MDDDAPKLWSFADLEPNKGPEVLAEELAVHFTNITNKAKLLEQHEIPVSNAPNVLIPQLLESNIAKRLKEYKKPNSLVPGDIPKGLIAPLVDNLACPLTRIQCLPSVYKMAQALEARGSNHYTKDADPTELQ